MTTKTLHGIMCIPNIPIFLENEGRVQYALANHYHHLNRQPHATVLSCQEFIKGQPMITQSITFEVTGQEAQRLLSVCQEQNIEPKYAFELFL